MIPTCALLPGLQAALRHCALMMFAALTASIGSAHAQPAAAGLQSYDVELIVLRPLSPDATPELWTLEAATAGQQPASEDGEPDPFAAPSPATPAARSHFPALAPSRFKLNAIEETLRRSRKYQPLAHFGWTQPGYPRNAAHELAIDSLVPAASGITGQVALSRGRYLHLTLDLVYEAPGAPGASPQRYVLRQTRRMRSHERHYIDHPRFGVIALITPTGG